MRDSCGRFRPKSPKPAVALQDNREVDVGGILRHRSLQHRHDRLLQLGIQRGRLHRRQLGGGEVLPLQQPSQDSQEAKEEDSD